MKLIKPPKLKTGNNIGIIALSTPAKTLKSEFRHRAYQKIKELYGFNIIEAPNLDTQIGHSAGSIKERVKSLHDFFKNKNIHGILSFWGGMNTHQILEYLDYDLIKKNPKVLIGYSDSTSLLAAIHQQTGLVTFNGPAVITYAKPQVLHETIAGFQNLITNPQEQYQLPISEQISDNQWWVNDQMDLTKNSGMKCFKKGQAEGRIIGGNVGTLLLLAGTPYWPKMKNRILFVEDDEGETTKSIDRYFTQLRHMGVFEQISGMVVGRFSRSVGFNEQDSLEMILNDALKGYDFPVMTDFDLGHTDPILTIPMEIKVRINATKKQITLLESAVRAI